MTKQIESEVARNDVRVESLVGELSIAPDGLAAYRLPPTVLPAHKGIFPCFLAGKDTLLPSSSLKAAINFSLVSEGSMISSR